MIIPVLFAIFKLIIIFFKRVFNINEGSRVLNTASSKNDRKRKDKKGKLFQLSKYINTIIREGR